MKHNWRGLFNEIKVAWRDRGKNTSQNNVNICCPWCGDDGGFHLAISEEHGAYYCWRNPRHAGRDPLRLIAFLVASRDAAVRLLNKHRKNVYNQEITKKPVISDVSSRWDFFDPAYQSHRCLDYLENKRGIPYPREVCRQYDIRHAPVGNWAARIILPIHSNDKVISWIGRSMHDRLLPKYYLLPNSPDNLIYVPRAARKNMIIVEGPLDALKGAAATEDQDVSFLALMGKNLNYGRQARIKDACFHCENVFVCLDNSADVLLTARFSLVDTLAPVLVNSYVRVARAPASVKDVADMGFVEIGEWARRITEAMNGRQGGDSRAVQVLPAAAGLPATVGRYI